MYNKQGGAKMIIEIDVESEVPIYTQLVKQIKRGVMLGKLTPGDNLPSVRRLAGDIGINLHTVNKAYKTLVSEGVVEQMKKGYAIASVTPPKISSEHLIEMKNQIEELLIDASIFEIDIEEIMMGKREELKGEKHHD